MVPNAHLRTRYEASTLAELSKDLRSRVELMVHVCKRDSGNSHRGPSAPRSSESYAALPFGSQLIRNTSFFVWDTLDAAPPPTPHPPCESSSWVTAYLLGVPGAWRVPQMPTHLISGRRI